MRIINYISYYIIRIIRWKCNNVFLSLFRFLPKMTKRCAILSKRAPISPCRNISMSFSFHKKKIRHTILFQKKNLIHGWYSHKIYYSSPNWKNSSFSMSRTYFFVWEWFLNARCVFPQWISRSTLISDRKISSYLECYFDCSIKYILISWVIVSCSNMLNVC